ncbi:MAG: SDR family NAD(P)-dependent oxidoreductase, partial [Bacteroidia bacterium]|nr:SDR family NAD(P)-dependent oxidoreductase [Bacteroidia bacterium]
MRKTTVITGASSGIGKALAETFARAGYAVVINGRNIQTLEETATNIRSAGGEVLVVAGDVSLEEDCKKLIETCMSSYGRIDVLVNNAGISMRALFETVDLSVLRKLMDVNFWGTVYCTRYALPELLKSKGSIVGISSIAGKKG